MKQKTVVLDEMAMFIPELGDEVILLEKDDMDHTWFDLARGRGGIGGNLNSNIKRYHGWRGTSYGTSTYAHGLRKVIKKWTDKKGNIHITVGKDLHPDWE